MLFDEERKYYVYVWYYKDTEKIFYVGKGTKYRYRSRKRDNLELVEILNSFDCDSKIIKDGLNELEAFELEKQTIKLYRDQGHPLINKLDGGHMPPNHKGKSRSDETKNKMRDSMKKYFKNHPEIAEKNSNRMKEFLKTEKGKEFQKKSIESRNNVEFRKEQSIRCKKANQSEEYIARQSEIIKKIWESEEYANAHKGANNSRAQAVRQYDLQYKFIAEYPTMTEAYQKTGVKISKISLAAKGSRKTAGGYIWEYVNEKKFNSSKPYTRARNIGDSDSSIPILQFDKNGNLISEYKSIADATRINNYKNRTNIIANLKGRTKTAYGYVWKYK